MFKCINGWNKEKMIETLKKEYKGQAVAKDTNICQYLTSDGKKCAVGCFIPDGHEAQYYNVGVQYIFGGNSLLSKYPDLISILPLEHSGLYKFQVFHDERDRSLDDMIQWVNDNVE